MNETFFVVTSLLLESMDEREQLVVIIVCSVVGGLILLTAILIFVCCLLRERATYERRYRPSHRHRSSRKYTKKPARVNTNDSSISVPFDPPHLINQNVKHLDQLLSSNSTLTAKSWYYTETAPASEHQSNPVYPCSSTMSTSVSDLVLALRNYQHYRQQPTDNLQTRFLSELDDVLRTKRYSPSSYSLGYSQSYRPSSSHSSTLTTIHSSLPRTIVYSNPPWRDNTAILY